MKNTDTSRYTSLDKFIKEGVSNSYNIQNLHYYTKVNDLTLPTLNILRERYYSVIFNMCVYVELDDIAYENYKYQPKKLSKDLYGTIDLWHIIIWINGMTSVTEFNRRKIVLFDQQGLDTLVKIINLEEQRIIDNRANPDVQLETKQAIRR